MNSQSPWNYLRQGSAEPALSIIRERYKRNPDASHIMELGVAYLWVGDYHAAEQLFQNAIKTHPTPGDIFYGMAGAAKWCADDPRAAVRHWHEGLDAPYAVGGVGIHLPLLLFLAATLRPGVYPRDDIEKILLKRSEDPRAACWPGSLARFVLGLDSDVERIMDFRAWPISALEEAERKQREEADKKSREWLVKFYGSLLELDKGNLGPMQFKEFMREATDTSKPDCSNEHYFLSLLWSEEFFIARHEASSVEEPGKTTKK